MASPAKSGLAFIVSYLATYYPRSTMTTTTHHNTFRVNPSDLDTILRLESERIGVSVADLGTPHAAFIPDYRGGSMGFTGQIVILLWDSDPTSITTYQRPTSSDPWSLAINCGDGSASYHYPDHLHHPIRSLEDGMRFLRRLHAENQLFHLEDDPGEVGLFTDGHADLVRHRLRELYALDWQSIGYECPISYVLEISPSDLSPIPAEHRQLAAVTFDPAVVALAKSAGLYRVADFGSAEVLITEDEDQCNIHLSHFAGQHNLRLFWFDHTGNSNRRETVRHATPPQTA